jgi:hypothetical protein
MGISLNPFKPQSLLFPLVPVGTNTVPYSTGTIPFQATPLYASPPLPNQGLVLPFACSPQTPFQLCLPPSKQTPLTPPENPHALDYLLTPPPYYSVFLTTPPPPSPSQLPLDAIPRPPAVEHPNLPSHENSRFSSFFESPHQHEFLALPMPDVDNFSPEKP